MTDKKLAYILVIGGLLGLYASFTLTVDTIKLLEDPNVSLPCNINPLVSCKSVATAWQSRVFGFPNPILGVAAFSALFVIGVMLLNGGKPNRNFWLLVNYGNIASMLFVLWFIYQSVFKIGSLCIYCMAVWAVTWPIFLYTLIWSQKEEHLRLGESFSRSLAKHHLALLIGWYLLIILLILIRFREFFFA